MISDQVREYLKGVEAVVEANNFEKHVLWQMYSKQSAEMGFGLKLDTTLLDWHAGGMGYLSTVGHVGTDPICISLLVDTIDGQRVLFWYASSAVADHRLIEAWLKEHVSALPNHADAQNFHNVLSPLKRKEAA